MSATLSTSCLADVQATSAAGSPSGQCSDSQWLHGETTCEARLAKEHHMRDLHLLVVGMGCRRCVRDVTARLRDVPGVERVVADASTNRVQLTGSMSRAEVLAALADTDFVARVLGDPPACAPSP